MSPFFNPFGFLQQSMAVWTDMGARMNDAATTGWLGTAAAAPDRSWYRPPAPQGPASPMAVFFPFLTPSQPVASWPFATWQSATPASASAFNPMSFWQAWMPSSVLTPQGWTGTASASQALLAGPLAKACATFWFELMRQGMTVASSPAAMTELLGAGAANPFAAYRSNGGHAVAQITFAPSPATAAFGMFDPTWMSAAFGPFGSKQVH